MKKKIYAVRKGRKTGIFTEWLEAYVQIRGFSNAEFRGFSYLDTLDEKDENLKGSLAYATAQAEAYLKGNEWEEIVDEKADSDKTETAGKRTGKKKIDTDKIQTFEDMDAAIPFPWDELNAENMGFEDMEPDEYELEHTENPFYKEEMESKNPMLQLVAKTSALAAKLKTVIKGQDEVIHKLEKAHFHAEKNSKMPKQKKGPKAVYLFAGPPGVGKTFLAETYADALKLPYKRFDMSGYNDKYGAIELVGSSSTYKDSKAGELTEFAMKHPKSVILFDEIEKAHRTVILLLLRLLDEGVCEDHFNNQNVSFEDAILIFTTNVGKQLYEGAFGQNLTALSDRVVMDALKKDINSETKEPYFPPEIVSRLASHTVLMFNHLSADIIRDIIHADVTKQLEQTEKTYHMNMKAGSEYLVSTVQFSAGIAVDARKASKASGKIIDREMYELAALVDEKRKSQSMENIQWGCDFTGASEEVKALYRGETNGVIAVFGELEEHAYPFLEETDLEILITIDEAVFRDTICNKNVIFAVVQYEYDMQEIHERLSIVDTSSKGKDILAFLQREKKDIPVYVLYGKGYVYSESEKEELMQNGVADFIHYYELAEKLEKAYRAVCCKKAMQKLERQHLALSFDTRNEYHEKTKTGKIIFCNLKLERAVDAEDKYALLTKELRPNKKWEDIWVSEDVKEELEFFIHYLQHPEDYVKQGIRSPRGVLMYGPPGTGKTSLAKVVASESDVNFIAVTADVLLQGGAGYVSGLFRTARKYAPTVLFIDEIDAIGIHRKRTGANATLNALLTEMDGFSKTEEQPVFVMAATNMGSEIDPALARRFDRRFCVGLPNRAGREWVLRRLIFAHKNMFSVSETEIENIALRSMGMSPAALENVIETALREGLRSGKIVDDVILDEAFEKCLYGEEREQKSMEELRRVACHEAGHALIHMYFGRTPDYMTIVSRGDFGGYVLTTDMEGHPTKETLLEKICSALGGRAAELEFGYGLTPGASSDIASANEIAKRMVCRFGMYEEEVGLLVIPEDQIYNYPNVENLIRQILSEQLKRAREIIRQKRNSMEGLMEAVLSSEQRYLTGKELREIYEKEEGTGALQ